MSDNPVHDTRQLAEAHGLTFKDLGNGHVQISGHGVLVNYYPLSKKRTAHVAGSPKGFTNCRPWDAVQLCRSGNTRASALRAKKVTKNEPDVDLTPVTTNPAGLRHFYNGDVPPWDESIEYRETLTESDAMRMAAYRIENELMAIRALADEMDEEAELLAAEPTTTE